MKMNKKQLAIISHHFKLYEDNQYLTLESWTDGGVDMIIYISKTMSDSLVKQFEDYINRFDIDEEIDLHRQDCRYRNAFRIVESVNDFSQYIKDMKSILKQLKSAE